MLDHITIDLRHIYQKAGCSDHCHLTAGWEEDLDRFVVRHRQRLSTGDVGTLSFQIHPRGTFPDMMEPFIDCLRRFHHLIDDREAPLDPS